MSLNGATRRLPLVAIDVARALALTVLTLYGAIGESHPIQTNHQGTAASPIPVPPWPAYLLVVLAAVVLVLWRRHPVGMLAISLAAALAYTALGFVNGAVIISPTLALYAVATVVPWRRAVAIAVGVYVLLEGFTIAFNPPAFGPFGGATVLVPGLVATALFAGLAVGNRRAYVEAIRARAEMAERTRDDEARRQVDAERLRIARELHDVVAHTMATINVQAGVAAHITPDLPESVAQTLEAIRSSSKNGLRELRAILSVLRQADETDPTQPTPGLTNGLDVLLARVSAAGLPTRVETVGVPRPLPPAIELAAYRIVQESLTNALRHAGTATATVRLHYKKDELSIQVADTGHGSQPPPGAGGHGLIGMRERAAASGGSLHAAQAPSGGFVIEAVLPLPADS